ncbi:DUF1801 domain-containing protein [Leucobacter allii]|uniref:DUF1801 domain-containing protein n=1 Tax=Leucobacter allii TaxID=2932247 RepID=A0ABY4FNG4_9MICO|nr:DUF1801 domain-containing protein [Leucobacter allii]UOQ57786.1 DUF1801 domain-containing protein [Leucobacter allii]
MADDVETYLAGFPAETRERLEALRWIVREECPRAVEGVMYGMIGTKLNGHPLVYFGGFAKHIGLYATPTGHEAFAEEFARYEQGKGSVRFPLAEPLPSALIRRVIAFRARTVGEALPAIGAPATRALAGIGVTQFDQLRGRTARELLALHGFGPKALRILREAGARIADE